MPDKLCHMHLKNDATLCAFVNCSLVLRRVCSTSALHDYIAVASRRLMHTKHEYNNEWSETEEN